MKIPVEKNQEYIVNVIDNGFEGEGIAKIDNYTIFIPNALKDEKVKILIVKVLSSHAFAKIVDILEPSKSRQIADCDTYKRCGGCNLRHIKYEETLKIKQNMVQNLVNKNLKQSGVELKFTTATFNYLVKNGTNEDFGARPLRRLITTKIEDELADKMLKGEVKAGDQLLVDCKNDKLTFLTKQVDKN